jgi:hypothetical protein
MSGEIGHISVVDEKSLSSDFAGPWQVRQIWPHRRSRYALPDIASAEADVALSKRQPSQAGHVSK